MRKISGSGGVGSDGCSFGKQNGYFTSSVETAGFPLVGLVCLLLETQSFDSGGRVRRLRQSTHAVGGSSNSGVGSEQQLQSHARGGHPKTLAIIAWHCAARQAPWSVPRAKRC